MLGISRNDLIYGILYLLIANVLQFAGPVFVSLIIGNMANPSSSTYYYGYWYAFGLFLAFFTRVITQ